MKHRAVLVALTTVLLSPSGASSQESYREWLGLCLGPDAAFQACANISIWTRFDPVREYTHATYQVANLQGWGPALPNSGPTSLYAFQVHGIEYAPPSWNMALPYYANSFRQGEASTVGNADLLGISQHERSSRSSRETASREVGSTGVTAHLNTSPGGPSESTTMDSSWAWRHATAHSASSTSGPVASRSTRTPGRDFPLPPTAPEGKESTPSAGPTVSR